MKSGLHSSPFFTVPRMLFLLVRLACMALSTGLWHRLSNSLPWACLSLFPLREVAKPGQRLCSISLCKRGPCHSLVMPLWLRGFTWRVGLRLLQVAGSLLVVVSLLVQLMLGRRGAVGVSTPDVSQSLASSSLVFQVGMLSQFLINGSSFVQ